MTWTVLAALSLILAGIPALLFVANLRAYRPPPRPGPDGAPPAISLLIPARDEQGSIDRAVSAALASRGVALEVIVLDDHSRDATAAIVAELAARDPRVKLRTAPDLPPGWCGKQFACAMLAGLARSPLLAFVDADVRLAPDGLARLAAFLDASGADLASGIPKQETVGVLERLVIPLVHFILLGFLPVERMRRSPRPALSAGCGQLFIARRSSYEAMGGHAAIRASLHDGITLPRAFRAAGFRTDLCDATEVASCRMYRSPRDLWNGLAKNAGEALAAPALIGPATLLLIGGQVLPVALLGLAPWLPRPAVALTIPAAIAAYLPRLIAVGRFRQSLAGAVLHPLGVLVLVAIQWYAFVRDALGRPATWKGRPYPARPAATAGP
jgi:Glycosyl transferase family 2